MRFFSTVPIYISVLFFLGALSAGAMTLPAVGDTYIRKGFNGRDAARNFGSEKFLNVINEDGTRGPKEKDSFALLRFDLNRYNDGAIASASLNLRSLTSQRPGKFIVYGIPDGVASEKFDEHAITFGGFHHTSLIDDGSLDPDELLPLGTFSLTSYPETLVFSSPELVDYLSNDRNKVATFVIFRTTESGNMNQFASKEDEDEEDRPKLVIIPEVRNFGLWAGTFGLLCLAARRRA